MPEYDTSGGGGDPPKVGDVVMDPETFETAKVTRVNREESLVDVKFLEEGAVEVGMATMTIGEFEEKFETV